MTRHVIVLDTAKPNTYGVLYKSRNVYQTSKSNGPTRLVVWDNTSRVNFRDGEPVRFGECGPIDGGNGCYLDPNNKATNHPTSLLLTPESSVITDSGMNTGTVASGQVYANTVLRDGEYATVSFPNGIMREICLHFPAHHNGHGYATYHHG